MIFSALLPRRAADPARLQRKLRKLELDAAGVAGGARAARYVRMAELAADGRQRLHALRYYGHAIDIHLETSDFEAAAALCRTVIERFPTVVRARCTLAFLMLGMGHVEDAVGEIDRYVAAARRAGRTDVAITRLRLMMNATDTAQVRATLAGHLQLLGDGQVHDNDFATGRGALAVQAHREDQRARWARLLRVDLTGPTRF